jgi:DNA-directed RNA polymerase subunit RPC12/RpoP
MKIRCANCDYLFTYVEDNKREFDFMKGYVISEIACPDCDESILVRTNLDYSKIKY